jgi:uncharacterized protein YecT (DUF1311 family)
MRPNQLVATILIACAPVSPAAAQAADCQKASTQTDLTACAGARAQASDAALNVIFQKLLAKISEDGRTRLRNAERAWLAYRDKQCAFDTMASEGGSIHPMVEAECRRGLTQAQTAHLAAQLSCSEGDMSCGGQ